MAAIEYDGHVYSVFLNAFIFMKGRVIHDNHTLSLKLWYQCELTPVIENLFIDVGL